MGNIYKVLFYLIYMKNIMNSLRKGAKKVTLPLAFATFLGGCTDIDNAKITHNTNPNSESYTIQFKTGETNHYEDDLNTKISPDYVMAHNGIIYHLVNSSERPNMFSKQKIRETGQDSQLGRDLRNNYSLIKKRYSEKEAKE